MSEGIVRKKIQAKPIPSDIRYNEADKENLNTNNQNLKKSARLEENDPEMKKKQIVLNEIKATDCKIRDYLSQLAEKREKTRQILQENFEKLQNETESQSFLKTECSPIRMLPQDYLKTSPNNSNSRLDQNRTSHKKNNSLPINSSDFLSNDSQIKITENPKSNRESGQKYEKSKSSAHRYLEENRSSQFEKTSSFFSKYDSFIEKSLLKSRNALSPSTRNILGVNAGSGSNIAILESSLSPKREKKLSEYVSLSKEDFNLGLLMPSQRKVEEFIIFNKRNEELVVMVKLEAKPNCSKYFKDFGLSFKEARDKGPGSERLLTVKLPAVSHRTIVMGFECEAYTQPPNALESMGLNVTINAPNLKHSTLNFGVKFELEVPRLGIIQIKEEYQCKIQGGKLEVEFNAKQTHFEIVLRNEGKSDFTLEFSQILNSENLLTESINFCPKAILLFPGSNHRFSFKLNAKTLSSRSRRIAVGFLATINETNVVYPVIFYINK